MNGINASYLNKNSLYQQVQLYPIVLYLFTTRLGCGWGCHNLYTYIGPRSVTFTRVNETVSISTNKRLQNQYPCTRPIF